MGPDFGTSGLAHVLKKLIAFIDKDMLQLFEFERFLFDHVIGKRSRSMRFDKPACLARFNCVSDVRAFEPNLPARDRAESSCF